MASKFLLFVPLFLKKKINLFLLKKEMSSVSTSSRSHMIRSSLLQALAEEAKGLAQDECPAVAQVRSHPALTNPSWAMEELARIDGTPSTWERTFLSPKVWCNPTTAAAGSGGHAPFNTTAEDAVKF